jgi:hypothetical protein
MMTSPSPRSPPIQGEEGCVPFDRIRTPVSLLPLEREDRKWGRHDGFALPSIPSHRGRGRARPLRQRQDGRWLPPPGWGRTGSGGGMMTSPSPRSPPIEGGEGLRPLRQGQDGR